MSNRISGSKPSSGHQPIADSKAKAAGLEKGAKEAQAAGDAKDAANISTAQSVGSTTQQIGSCVPGPYGAAIQGVGTAVSVGAGIAGTTKAKGGAAKGAGVAGTVATGVSGGVKAAGSSGGPNAKKTLEASQEAPKTA